MVASVSRLTPNRGSISGALAAYRAARLQACLSELNGLESVEAALLRARAFLRLSDPKRAKNALDRVEPSGDRDRSESSLLLAVARARMGDEDAASFMRDAFVYSVSSLDAALEAEVEYYRAALAFADGKLSKANQACLRALDVASTGNASKAGGIVPLAHVISRTEELLGVIGAGEGDYGKWQRYAQAALATLDGCHTRDAFQEAFALRNLALLARDFDTNQDANALAERIRTFEWTADLTRPRFATLESLGWCSALRGDVPGALRNFRNAADAATIVPERVNVAVDRALIARELGHRAMVTEEVGHALELTDNYDWNQAPGDYCLVLLPLAQIAAALDATRARKALKTYGHIRDSMDSAYVGRLELRVRAEESYAHGIVLRAEGRTSASGERLQNAFTMWTRIGFEWRAARAALELAELNAGDVYRLAVRRDLLQRPASIFAQRARLVA